MSPAQIEAACKRWEESELSQFALRLEQPKNPFTIEPSKYNPTPGTGKTGFTAVPPNNYPFYSDDEKYVPIIQPDGGQLSEWVPMYAPTKEEAEADRAKAYASGVPHGYKSPDALDDGMSERITLRVVSDIHDDSEYGIQVDPKTGQHSGGPFTVHVSPKIRVEKLRCVIRDIGGIIPGLQKLSFAGKRMEDSQRTLEHYGVSYWHKRFPHWPIKVYKY